MHYRKKSGSSRTGVNDYAQLGLFSNDIHCGTEFHWRLFCIVSYFYFSWDWYFHIIMFCPSLLPTQNSLTQLVIAQICNFSSLWHNCCSNHLSHRSYQLIEVQKNDVPAKNKEWYCVSVLPELLMPPLLQSAWPTSTVDKFWVVTLALNLPAKNYASIKYPIF